MPQCRFIHPLIDATTTALPYKPTPRRLESDGYVDWGVISDLCFTRLNGWNVSAKGVDTRLGLLTQTMCRSMCSLCVAFSPIGTSSLPRQEEYPHDAQLSTWSKNRGCLRRPRRHLYLPISSLPLRTWTPIHPGRSSPLPFSSDPGQPRERIGGRRVP
ncbi:hypothetical protein FA13DRAFT_1177758 [Coprinellus micaceus]|uniref:Uncharacterized protein n=1 Tax=Coprinellus micaceus TaxID=71717 RepID=A0A4Y7STX3_COPMI|nr:hypothetical protein FA13DRAFT_1177758 [Coprinellus micaceus]